MRVKALLLSFIVFVVTIFGSYYSVNTYAQKVRTERIYLPRYSKIEITDIKYDTVAIKRKHVATVENGMLITGKVGVATIEYRLKKKIVKVQTVVVCSKRWVLTDTLNVVPSETPTIMPSIVPTAQPTETSTPVVTAEPTEPPTPVVTIEPTEIPTPVVTVEPTATPVPDLDDDTKTQYVAELVSLINAERKKNGVAQLAIDWDLLNEAARLRADEMAATNNYVTRPDGSAGYTVLRDVGIIEGVHTGKASEPGHGRYEYQLYNIVHNSAYYNRATPSKAFAYFQSNTREDMLEKGPTHMGVGVARSATGIYYWYVIYVCKI